MRQFAAFFSRLDHVVGDAILEAAAGVLSLQLGEDAHAWIGAGASQLYQRCIADSF